MGLLSEIWWLGIKKIALTWSGTWKEFQIDDYKLNAKMDRKNSRVSIQATEAFKKKTI